MKKYNIGLVGASGLVGGKIMEILEERNFPIENFIPMASEKSQGEIIRFKGKEYSLIVADEEAFDIDMDIVFFAAGSHVSKKLAPIAVDKGIVVVDNSSVFRMGKDIPLIVPEVNPEDLKEETGIIANPNCSTIQCMLPLKALKDVYGIERVVYSTYQSVSGSGLEGLRDLDENLCEFYPYPINGNVLPHIDDFLEDGYTKEEYKMINETRKILHDPDMKVTATTVRVPVRFAHSVSVNLELKKEFDLEDVRRLLADFPGIILKDDPSKAIYPIAQDAEGRDEVFVGRVRRDFSRENSLNFWIVADNIRKGAATNAVQIGELIVKKWGE